MKEDFIVTCSVHILHFRLMQILGRYSLTSVPNKFYAFLELIFGLSDSLQP